MPKVLLLLLCATAAAPVTPASPWETLAPGVELAEFEASMKSQAGDSRVTVLRVDVARRPVRLLNATREGLPSEPTAEEWAQLRNLLAVSNAGMFHPDGSPVGLARFDGKEITSSRAGSYRSFLVLQPVEPGLPPVQILDPECDDVEALLPRYRTVLQSIRMVDCKGRNRWSAQPRLWSTATVGVDAKGRLLLLHARSPYRAHDFVQIAQRLPIGLTRMMYLEGGPEASLHISAPGRTVRRFGSFETGFNENDDNDRYWGLPNVIGVSAPGPRESPAASKP
jgi:uncharacterized protein YigE (DUF2233 family)